MTTKSSKKTIFFLIFFFSLLAVLFILPRQAGALGVYEYDNKPIYYEPGLEAERYFEIAMTDKDIKISIDGSLEEYATLSRDIIKKNDADRSVIVKLKFPKEGGVKPGHHKLYLHANEVVEGGGAPIGTAINILTHILIHVYYQDKYLEIDSYTVDNINLNENLTFKLLLTNFGKTDISSIKPTFYVYDLSNNLVATVPAQQDSLPALETRGFSAITSSEGWLPGEYKTRAVILWDGNESHAETSFKVGHYFVEILNNTEVVEAGKIGPFFIEARNVWNSEMKNVYGIIDSTGKSAKTPSFDLGPWETKRLETYFDASGFEPGQYPLGIMLFYENTYNEKNSTLTVIKPEEKQAVTAEKGEAEKEKKISAQGKMIIILALVIALIVVGDIIWLRIQAKKRKDTEQKGMA